MPSWGPCPGPGKRPRRSWRSFGPTRRNALHAYRAFVAEGIPRGRRPEFQGGGLIRSLGGWQVVAALRRGREVYQGDERILGGTEFVEALRQAAEARSAAPRRCPSLARVLAAVVAATGCLPEALRGPSRSAQVARAREGAAYLWCRVGGQVGRELAAALSLSHQAVSAAATRGEHAAARWRAVWSKLQ